MSAFMVSDDIIDLIVTFAVTKKVYFYDYSTHRPLQGSPETATDIGRILIAENERSVCHRYRQTQQDLAAAYVWRPFRTVEPTAIAAIFAACDLLEYQSCETDDWHLTRAHAMLADIRAAAGQALKGYDDVRLGFLHELRIDERMVPPPHAPVPSAPADTKPNGKPVLRVVK